MQSSLVVLDKIRIASHCTVPWASMAGDDRVRHCSQCDLPVYNLSAMSRDEAESFVRQREGRLCVAFYRRLDGTLLTADCPRGIRSRRRRFRAFIAVAAVVTLAIMNVASLFGMRRASERRIAQIRPVIYACREIEGRLSLAPVRRLNPPVLGALMPIPLRPSNKHGN